MVRPLKPIDLVVAGPTASGKTCLAISWAKILDAEIISADSRQVYREISIGTGKPSKEDRDLVRHHLFDLCSVTDTYSAGDFVRDAKAAIHDIQERGKRVIVCGGTGLYMKALLQGLVNLPERDFCQYESYRKDQERLSTESLYNTLKKADSRRAMEIHPHDRVRILRAMYLMEKYSAPPTELYERFRGEGVLALRVVGLDPGRETLHLSISDRVSSMLKEGWVDEVEALLKAGVSPMAPGFNSLGYREILDCLMGKGLWDTLESRIVLKTRQYAKRQRTWFRHMEDITWISPSDSGSFFLEPSSNYGTIKKILHEES